MPSRHRPIPGSQPCPRHRPASARAAASLSCQKAILCFLAVPPDGKGGANQATVEGEAAGGEKIADRVFNKRSQFSRLSNIFGADKSKTRQRRSPYLLPCRAARCAGCALRVWPVFACSSRAISCRQKQTQHYTCRPVPPRRR